MTFNQCGGKIERVNDLQVCDLNTVVELLIYI